MGGDFYGPDWVWWPLENPGPPPPGHNRPLAKPNQTDLARIGQGGVATFGGRKTRKTPQQRAGLGLTTGLRIPGGT